MSDDLYQSAIVELARSGQDHARLDAPDASVTLDNPLCGDRVTIDVRAGGRAVTEVGFRVRGCLLCEASGALIARHAPQSEAATLVSLRERIADVLRADSIDAAQQLIEVLGEPWQGLRTFLPVRGYKSRHECVLLPFEALGNVVKALPPT
jgi:nitrogen fixation NifU-like protein